MKPGVAARVNAERVVLLGWSRAILLQLAHPLVAAGVADHSSFRAGPLTTALRLHHTVRAMLSLTFGSRDARDATLARINAIHRRVNGTLREAVGVFPAGTRYSAEDPALLLWVHATLLESIPLVYELVVSPLTAAEKDEYCREAAPVVRALGAREDVPESWTAAREYLSATYGSGSIAVGADARSLAASVLSPPFSWAMTPAARVNRLFAVGLLPAWIREQYGFSWSPADQRSLDRWTRWIRSGRRALPALAALWPEARRRERTGVDG